ncbi:DUF6086 family protein [Streptomyces polygonati]|uniref:DUF6086 family protein n=1 Tax=Streptomyces polygonati TaxID=1617087 RepID=A0ABV8HPH6_9ACTN
MDFWIQTGSPEARDVPGVVDNMPEAVAEMYPADTDRMILSWNGVPVSLVYCEDVQVMVDDIAAMLAMLAEGGEGTEGTGKPGYVRWGPSGFQAEWRIDRDGGDLVIDSRWDSVDWGPADLLNERGRLVVPAAYFRGQWLKVLRLLVDDITARSVVMEDTLIFDRVRAVLAAGTLPAASAEQIRKGARIPQATNRTGSAENTVEFRAVAGESAESGPVLWTVDSAVARLFTGHAALVSRLLGVPSGIGVPSGTGAGIDVAGLRDFCGAALDRYGLTDEGIERSLTVGFLATALELLHRAGHDVPPTDPAEQRAAWTALRDQHALQMPR